MTDLLLVLVLAWWAPVSRCAFQAIPLDGLGWTVSNGTGPSFPSYAATVPGQVHLDLKSAGAIPEPYYRYGDRDLKWVFQSPWTYRLEVDIPAAAVAVLEFDGLDTFASVSESGNILGTTENQHRAYRFALPAKTHLSLAVLLSPAVDVAASLASGYPYPVPDGSADPTMKGQRNRNFARKEQSSFGWDWGPAFVPAGIWRPVRVLLATATSDIGAVRMHVKAECAASPSPPTSSPWLFDFTVDVEVFSGSDQVMPGGHFVVTLPTLGQTSAPLPETALVAGLNTVRVVIRAVPASYASDLWWPRSHGEQVLHPVKLLTASGQSAGLASKMVGLRKVELVQDNVAGSQPGKSYFFQINLTPVFAKGANYIPADAFEGRVTAEDTAYLLNSAAFANMNMIRVWGGGIYQAEDFYAECDHLGIMVWQEILFACAMYPTDTAFLANVREEVRHQVTRLAHHPSIVLWSGNNENLAALTGPWYPEITENGPPLYTIDFNRLYDETVRREVVALDTSRPFVISSPSNGIIAEEPYTLLWRLPVGDTSYGDVHFYSYDNRCDDVTLLPQARFVSEYGWQSFPSLRTLQPTIDSQDYDINSPLMDWRQHHPNGTAQLEAQLGMHFTRASGVPINTGHGDPAAFADYLYVLQVVQEVCIGTQTEFYRAGQGFPAGTMGALYWQLNDVWQGPSWSSIEYGGRWKPLHSRIRRAFAALAVTPFELTKDTLAVWAVSDLPVLQASEVTVRAFNWTSGLSVTLATVTVPPMPSGGAQQAAAVPGLTAKLASFGLTRSSAGVEVTWTTATQGSASRLYLPGPLPREALSPAKFHVEAQPASAGLTTVTIESSAMAPFVFLEVDDTVPGFFSDNSLLLYPHTAVTVTFTARDGNSHITPDNIVVRDLWSALGH